MDENNLDSLLDELSSMDGELNENIDIDSGVDVDADDMDDISLDELVCSGFTCLGEMNVI